MQAKNTGAYAKLLGPAGFVQLGSRFAAYRALDAIARVRPLQGVYSVAGALRKHRVPVHCPKQINAPEFHGLLRRLEVDLLISVACPQIIKSDLLQLPPKGCINIHGALLPKYRGKMPSFWVLAHGETETGVTVHYMNEKLDDGPILVQKRVPIAPDDTLHCLVLKSKVAYGADALAEAVGLIEGGNVRLQENDRSQMTYFSFPTPEAIAAFRQRGRKAI